MKKTILLALFITASFLPTKAQHSILLDLDGAVTGSSPLNSLISDGTFLYGMTGYGGTNDLGTIFKIMPDGTGYSKLLDFDGASNGSVPWGALVYDGVFLYGMTSSGGTNNMGVIFKILPDGTGYTKLLDFDGAGNGSIARPTLIIDGGFLYGMTTFGGTNNKGTIFKIKADGTGYSKLFDFTGVATGSFPRAALLSDGTFLYGTTYQGGTSDFGVVFKIRTDGTGYTKLLDFTDYANGSNGRGSLISDGTFLYGMTLNGGPPNLGTIFKIKPDGTGYVNLLNFTGVATGRNPYNALILEGGFLYGAAGYGGANDFGTIFKIKPDGTGFSKLLDFDGASNGNLPFGPFLSDGTFLYGMTAFGGANDMGTIFKYDLTTGIAESNSENNFIVYPNPFANQLTLKLNEVQSAGNEKEIRILDVSGKEILHQFCKNRTDETIINTSKISAGFYFLNYTDGNKTVSTKLVKF